jgi:hypothetical protein
VGEAAGVRYDPSAGVAFVVGLEGAPGARDEVIDLVAQSLGYTAAPSRTAPCTVGGLNGLESGEVSGLYEGWATGYEARVTAKAERLDCELSYRGDPFRTIRAHIDQGEWLQLDSLRETTSLEFFRDPETDGVCLAVAFAPYAMRRSDA